MTRLLSLLGTVLVVLTACSSPDPEPAPPPAIATPTTETLLDPTWPLTGAVMAEPGLAGISPVVGVKVENSGPARPWVGLADADLVFVEMVEAGMTRFHAVYHSTVPETVMPVRSLRPMDAAILGPWNATLLASGGQQVFIPRIEEAVGLRTIDRGDTGFHRDSSRRVPHNVYVTMSEILPSLPEPGEVLPIAEYDAVSSAAGGSAASLIRVSYPSARSLWEYSSDADAYLRSDDGTVSVEVDGTRISARNVLVLEVTTRDTGRVDPVGSPVLETLLTGSGSLHLISGGQVVEGTWAKGDDDEPLVLTDGDGDPLVLATGNTWIELLPERGRVSWE